MFKKVIKNTYILSLGTLASRILGFIRDLLLAKFFGTSGLLEAFIISFRLPNIFRSIFAEGFSDSVAAPILSEHHDDKSKLFNIGKNMLSLSAVVLFIFTVAGVIFSKYLVAMIAPGFIKETIKFDMTVSFTRITFIYLFFISFASNCLAILYSLKKFFISAINPIFLNISFIVGIIFFREYAKEYILVVCVLAAGLLQFMVPVIVLKKEGFSFKFNLVRALKDNNVIRMIKLFGPRLLSSVIYNLSVFIDTIFSSLVHIVGEGALASVYYANRLTQLPFALIAIAVSKVAIVDLSAYHKKNKESDFKNLFVFSFQNIIFFIIPISIIFIFIPKYLIRVIFARGEFDNNSLIMTSSVLFFYSFGLFFFCGIKLLVNSFYSLKDASTPAKAAGIALVINVILSSILMFPLKIGGVALGSSLAAVGNFLFLYHFFIKKVGNIDWKDTKSQFYKVFFLSLSLGIGSRFLLSVLNFNKYFNLFLSLLSFFLVFFAVGYFLRLKQIRYITKKIWVKK